MKARMIFLLVCLAGCLLTTKAQQAKGDETRLAPFRITLANGQYFQASQIPKGKPVLLVYFDPECDHCHTLMNDFFKRTADFRTADVFMITYKPLNEVQDFVKTYGLYNYPNIKAGTEGTSYFIRHYYRMQFTPFVALYNKSGKQVAVYQKDIPLDALHQQLKKM